MVTKAAEVVGYIRVSTGRQAESGGGLEAQRDAIQRECARRGWQLVEVFEDAGVTGKTTRRPALQAATAMIERGEASALVAAKLDRLSRSVVDFAGLVKRAQDRGWNLVTIDPAVDLATPSGKLVANVLAAVAEWEGGIISQRTKDAIAAKRAAGTMRGPIGRPRLIEPATVERIRGLRASGLPLARIADQLNADAVPTATPGSRWHASTVRSVLVQN